MSALDFAISGGVAFGYLLTVVGIASSLATLKGKEKLTKLQVASLTVGCCGLITQLFCVALGMALWGDK